MDYIIDFRRCIGKGGYGFVFEALRRVNSNDHTKSRLISYCAKVFRNKIAFDSELQVLEHLSNEGISNIVQFVNAGTICKDNRILYVIIFERCDRDVYSFLESEVFSEKHAAKIMLDLLDGLTDLSKARVIHRSNCFDNV